MFKRSFSTLYLGIAAAIGASTLFSLNDTAIKFLSGDYALYQIVFMRASIGMALVLVVILPFEGGFGVLKTKRLMTHLMRGLCVVVANMAFFLALATMPLADASAIFYVSPLIITVFSVVFLGETVGLHRWFAVFVGLIGVIIMVRPGGSSFQFASFLPLISAIAYAGLHTFTRVLRDTEKAGTMTFYISLTFIVVGASMGLLIGHGQFSGSDNATLEFLLRAWTWPDAGDYVMFLFLGGAITGAGYLISQAYRLCEAGLVAPFEYTALILAIVWGNLVFGDWPDLQAWVGICLIVGSGMFMIWRENVHRTNSSDATPIGKR